MPGYRAHSICGREEMSEHCSLVCRYASAVFFFKHIRLGCMGCNLGSVWSPFTQELQYAKQRLFELMNMCNVLRMVAVVVTCWHIWEARNDIRNSHASVHGFSALHNQVYSLHEGNPASLAPSTRVERRSAHSIFFKSFPKCTFDGNNSCKK